MNKLNHAILVLITNSLLLITNNALAQYTKLLDFDGTSNGRNPFASLVSDGTFLYGMTSAGGANNMGTVFKINPDGTNYVKLLDFAGATNGRNPRGSLISFGGFLYGMTVSGGANDFGTIFKIKNDGTGYVKLLDFNDATNGSNPYGALIYDGTFLYGTTKYGGSNYIGTIFKIKPDGSNYVLLLSFAEVANGKYPLGTLLSDGTFLYGMTTQGGVNFGKGTIFKIKPDGSNFAKLLDFAGSTNGSSPTAALISDGTFLYGMTDGGGTNAIGTIFKIKPDGTGYVKLLDFNSSNGNGPRSSLISVGAFLYGMTVGGGLDNLGVLFKLGTDGTGFSKLFDFVSATGASPAGSLISDGTFFYGMTTSGGITNSMGTIFKFKEGGLEIGLRENYVDLSKSFTIAPNPFESQTNITFDEQQKKTTIKIIDVLGQEVKKISFTGKELSIERGEMKQGIYLLQIMDEQNNIVTKKIIVE